ncbi:MAG: hypothetical protein ABW143_09040 [Acidimicrobiales bacterium]
MADDDALNGGQHEFTPITSQEELDRAIGKRLERERAKFADYEDAKAKAAKYDEAELAGKSEVEKANARAEAAEAKAAAIEAQQKRSEWAEEITKDSPVPASALRGNTREELEGHFSELSALIKQPPPSRRATPPGKPTPDGSGQGRAAAALREMRQG